MMPEEDSPLGLAQALVRTLDIAVSDPAAEQIVLARDDVIEAIGLIESLIGVMILSERGGRAPRHG